MELAFIASCSSRSVGQLFIDAGVRHVVCATGDLLDEASMVFAGAFYGALDRGRAIKDAYALAKQSVIHSDCVIWTGLDPRTEANKFSLLPENDDRHDKILFPKRPALSSSATRPTMRVSALPAATHVPFPPKPFLGREIEMHHVLKKMIRERERLVTVTGERGIGKESFAKAIGHYMEKRQMWGERVYWIDDTHDCAGAHDTDDVNMDDIEGLLCHIMLIIGQHSKTATYLISFQADRKYQIMKACIFRLLSVKKGLIIINAKRFQCERSIELLSWFLHDLLENTQQTKLLVFHQQENPLKPPKMQGFPYCSNNPLRLKTLEFEEVFQLFGGKCQHGNEFPGTWRIVQPWSAERYNNYRVLFWKLLGSGNPTKTIVLARNISSSEYSKLIDASASISESDFRDVLLHLFDLEMERLDLAAGIFYLEKGKYNQASFLLHKSYHDHVSLWGKNHKNTLSIMEQLGQLYFQQGEFQKAHEKFKDCWTSRKQVLGSEDPLTLVAMDKLASTHHSLASNFKRQDEHHDAEKNLDEAKRLYMECYEKRLKILGEHHKDTLESLNNLAAYYYKVEDYQESRRLYEDCLPKRQGVLGENHPDTLITLNNLALLYMKQEYWELAEKRQKDCYERRKVALGEDHPNTLSSLNNLGKLCIDQGNYTKAIELLQKCSEGRKRVLGDNHPNTLKTMESLKICYSQKGKEEIYDGVKACYERQKLELGEENPKTLHSLDDLGKLCMEQENYAEAIKLLQACLKGRKRVLGDNHPDTLKTMKSLNSCYDPTPARPSSFAPEDSVGV